MKISILINNYNYDSFLRESIYSALCQDYDSTEIVVVDDGSTDQSQEIMSDFGSQIVSVVKNNGGQSSAFNTGFEASTGDLILFLDSDDYFYSGKAKQVVNLFQRHPDAGWCFHELEDVDANGKSLKRNRHRLEALEYVNLKPVLESGAELKHWFPATSGLCFRRQVLDQILPMPEQFRVSADSFLRLAAIYCSPGILSPTTLAVHRQHGNNLYDFRPDVHIERVKLGIQTAYHFQKKFPQTQAFNSKKFIFCFSKLIEYTSMTEALKIKESNKYIRGQRSLVFRFMLLLYIFKAHSKKFIQSFAKKR
jgi:glycosyltransferase involved in cell wall biosynthesis